MGTQSSGCQGALSHQSLPSPHRRFGCLSFDTKPSFPPCHCPSQGHSWHQPPPLCSSPLPKPERERSRHSWPVPLSCPLWPSSPRHPARDGLAMVSSWGGKNKRDQKGNNKKKIISFQPQRAKRESWGESERRRARCSPAVTPGERSESEQPY